MIRFSYLILFILILGQGAFAKSYTYNSIQKEKNKYEKELQETLQKRVEAVVPRTHFLLDVDVELKLIYDRAEDQINPLVFIDKLGVSTPLGERKIRKKRIYRSTLNKNIRKVIVDLNIDESIPDTQISDIKQVVYSMVKGIEPARIQFKSNRLILVGENYEVVIQRKIDNLNEFIDSNQSLFYGTVIILGIFLFGFMTYKLFSSWTNILGRTGDRILVFLESAFHSTGHGSQSYLDDKIEFYVEKKDKKAKSGKKPKTLKDVKVELAYFIRTAKERPVRLSILVNRWIFEQPEGYKEGIAIIPHILDHQTFGEVMLSLSSDVKNELSKCLGIRVENLNINRSCEFIQSYLPQMWHQDEDTDLEEIILSMTNDEYVDVLRKAPELSNIILQNITTEQSKFVLNSFPNFYMGDLIDHTVSNELDMNTAVVKLKRLIEEVRQEKAQDIPPTFLSHIITQLQQVPPEREKTILNMFKDNKRTEVLYHITKEVFPSELILDLPSLIIKQVLSSFSLEYKVRLLLSVASDKQESLRQCIAESGSREAQFVEFEIKRIQSSDQLLNYVHENAGETWKEFAHAVRRHIKTNKQAKQDAKMLLEKWIYQSLSQASKEVHLKKVS